MSALDPQLELPEPEGVTAELTEGTWENGTLTLSKDGEPEAWDVKAEVRANPVIDGYFADPNIVIFGDTYYIYPTTDGGTDWNSANFRCFSSKDLVNWKDEGVILELSDVPWSTGVYGWAPTLSLIHILRRLSEPLLTYTSDLWYNYSIERRVWHYERYGAD